MKNFANITCSGTIFSQFDLFWLCCQFQFSLEITRYVNIEGAQISKLPILITFFITVINECNSIYIKLILHFFWVQDVRTYFIGWCICNARQTQFAHDTTCGTSALAGVLLMPRPFEGIRCQKEGWPRLVQPTAKWRRKIPLLKK